METETIKSEPIRLMVALPYVHFLIMMAFEPINRPHGIVKENWFVAKINICERIKQFCGGYLIFAMASSRVDLSLIHSGR